MAYPGDRDWQDGEWNEVMVTGLLCNPVYAGIEPFPALVEDRQWIEAGVQLVKENGLRQYWSTCCTS